MKGELVERALREAGPRLRGNWERIESTKRRWGASSCFSYCSGNWERIERVLPLRLFGCSYANQMVEGQQLGRQLGKN